MSYDIERTLQAVHGSGPHRSRAAKRAVRLSCAIGLTATVAVLPAGRAIAAAEAPLAVHATSTAGPGSAGIERGTPSAYGIGFVPNTGQTDSRVRYSAQGAGFGFSFTAKEAVLAFVQEGRGMAIGLRFLGARAEPEGARQLPGRVNYLIGSDRTTWRTGLHTYREVVYRDLWPGIDLAFRGERGTLKYEFRLAAGADVRNIRLAYRGADRLSLGRDGALRIHTPFGLLRDTRPVSYQEIAGRRSPVASRFVLGAGGAYRFAVGRYDPRRPLVIDPGLVYSTYLGGTGNDQGSGITVDGAGSAYLTGFTASTNFPTTVGAFDPTFNGGGNDAFVTKLNPAGTSLVYSTYVGGSGNDQGIGVALDGAGSAYLTGFTASTNFPTTGGAFDTTFNGGVNDAFVTKLNEAGSALVYSTFLGGSGNDQGIGIALDGAASAYVTGITGSTNFPTAGGAFDASFNGVNDAFVAKLNAAGSALVYSAYLGGTSRDEGLAITVDARVAPT